MSNQPQPIPVKPGDKPPVRPARGLHYHGYAILIGGGSFLQSLILLILRLAWGWELASSGWSHLHDVQTMVDRFTKWGVPLSHASVYVSGVTELVGGILIMVGLGTRLVSLPLIFNFIVAYLTASKETVHKLIDGPAHLDGLRGIIDDTAFPFLTLMILLLAFGPGKVSIDYILQRTIFRSRTVAVPEVSP